MSKQFIVEQIKIDILKIFYIWIKQGCVCYILNKTGMCCLHFVQNRGVLVIFRMSKFFESNRVVLFTFWINQGCVECISVKISNKSKKPRK